MPPQRPWLGPSVIMSLTCQKVSLMILKVPADTEDVYITHSLCLYWQWWSIMNNSFVCSAIRLFISLKVFTLWGISQRPETKGLMDLWHGLLWYRFTKNTHCMCMKVWRSEGEGRSEVEVWRIQPGSYRCRMDRYSGRGQTQLWCVSVWPEVGTEPCTRPAYTQTGCYQPWRSVSLILLWLSTVRLQ